MGLNVENLFVRTPDPRQVLLAIQRFTQIAPAVSSAPADWTLPVQPPTGEFARRRVAISPQRDGWIQVCTSDEVVDPFVAVELSRQLKTDVVAGLVYETTGASGHVHSKNGNIVRSEWSESSPDPAGSVQTALKKLGIHSSLVMFREAVQLRQDGWLVQPAHNPTAA